MEIVLSKQFKLFLFYDMSISKQLLLHVTIIGLLFVLSICSRGYRKGKYTIQKNTILAFTKL